MSHPSSDEFDGEEETATSAIASPDNSLSQISLNPNNPNNNDSGIENGNSSNIVSTSEDNGDDDNSDFERDSTRRGHNIVTMRVAAPPTSAFYEGGGAGSQMVDVDLTPPDKLLKMATDRAAKLASKKKVEEAMAEQVKVLALTRIVFGDSHWRVPEAYVSLARAYLELRGLAEQARLHCETARALISQIAQQQSPAQRDNTLLVKLNMFLVMGRSLTKLKRFEEAESALNKADRCSRERNSSSVIDPSAMLRTDNTIATALGRLYFCQKKSQQALTCFEQVAEMTSKIYGDDADELISVYTDMGKAEQMGAGGGGGVGAEETSSSHSHEKAIEHFLHAHSIASANHPGSSSETAKTAEVVGNGYLTMAMSSAKPALTPDAVEDALRSSETYFTEAADIFLLEKGINHPDTIRVTEQLAKINIKLKDFEAAKKYAKTVLESKVEVYGDMSDETATSQQTLGTICLSQANFEEAHKLLKKAQHTLTQLLGPNAKRVKDIEKMIVIIEQSPQMRDKLSKEKHLHNRPAFSNNFKVK